MNPRIAVIGFLLFIVIGIAAVSVFGYGRVAEAPTGKGAETSSQSSE